MNESGRPISRIARWWKVPRPRLLIVSDDLDLPLGKLRMRSSGGSGGHNGLKSVIDDLGGTDFPRLRVGIGRSEEAIDHVLAPFEPDEWPLVQQIVEAAAEGAQKWLEEPFERAAEWTNSWHRALQ